MQLRASMKKVDKLTATVARLEKRMYVMEDENKKASVAKGSIGAVGKGSKGKRKGKGMSAPCYHHGG